MKPYAITKTLILAACSAIVGTVFGNEVEEEVKKIPLLVNTISRRIYDISTDIEKSVSTTVKRK